MTERIWKFFGLQPMPHLELGLLSKMEIVALASGEVSLPLTFDADSLEPIKGGLFCPDIFGPTRNRPTQEAAIIASYEPVTAEGKPAPGNPAVARGWFGRWGFLRLPGPMPHPWFSSCAGWNEAGKLDDVVIELLPVMPPGFRPLLPVVDAPGKWLASRFHSHYLEIARTCDAVRRIDRGLQWLEDSSGKNRAVLLKEQTNCLKDQMALVLSKVEDFFGAPCKPDEPNTTLATYGLENLKDVKEKFRRLSHHAVQGKWIGETMEPDLLHFVTVLTAAGLEVRPKQ